MSTTVTPGIAYAYGYSSTKAAEADTEFMASLPDDSQPKTALQVEMEAMWAEVAAEQVKIEADNKPATVWGTIQTEIGTATIFNEGGMAFTSTDGKSHSFADIADIDWESGYTPEELAAAIREKHFGILTTSSVESGRKSLTTELMSKMFSSDALVNRMFLTDTGETIQDDLAATDEDAAADQGADAAPSPASTAAAASGLLAVQGLAAAV
ncbi:hypothetical protein HGO34_23280 [Agrobacterium vitis]|uniref:Uncharacterized protein n=1 Tax=Agrobacterium vitis TaxID=373 RepID=A0AAE5AY73_AGRVI|nr:hypothetical protein [Agrobacterium vitis]MCF1500333.1 hypothetical protein [Allorhizobium sp. Av2]MCM2442626.1 hypothetical protein [Agrobacterium vitis]MUZ60414.1 hypothetical protein [Agrobacterium vitis]MVA68349.1 hypothetical protein [Agrobacterium vitis]MVA88779.1 hypothetical protein [Agrobacterium vitis]